MNNTYYPQRTELSKVINIDMYSRIQNYNSHHYKIRGQWFVRNGLEKVAKRLDKEFKDIISKESQDEIEKLILEYEILLKCLPK